MSHFYGYFSRVASTRSRSIYRFRLVKIRPLTRMAMGDGRVILVVSSEECTLNTWWCAPCILIIRKPARLAIIYDFWELSLPEKGIGVCSR